MFAKIALETRLDLFVFNLQRNTMIKRVLEKLITEELGKSRIIVLYGPRRVGKTTLVKAIGESYSHKTKSPFLFLNCDEPDVRESLSNKNSEQLSRIIGRHKFIIIDEAQRVENIGITLKLIGDLKLAEYVIATGSSSFDLANRINEPLTGRKVEFRMFPLLYRELMGRKELDQIERTRLIKSLLVYGSYPEVINLSSNSEKRDYLLELTESTLYKDILEFKKIRKSSTIKTLLKALAYQAGSEVSYPEIGQQIGIDRQTVESYINILEQAFIVYRLPPLTKNPRREISRFNKVFFVDNGIRNAIINRFEEFDDRNDRGELWENWAITERYKLHKTTLDRREHYFWRLKSGAEIDLVEDSSGKLSAYEFKVKAKKSFPHASWLELYGDTPWNEISLDTFEIE